jgi:hypothetical protein
MAANPYRPKMKEWEEFAIKGELLDLTAVRHITHLRTARRIIEDGSIAAGLVYDESRLNKSRLSVTWLSANSWNDGSIYGTVEFRFDWKKLVDGQRIYWVEAIKKYNPAAYRFLFTPREIKSDLVQQYDPVNDNGPLRRAGSNWYWNFQFTSEFMIERDLPLFDVTGLNFVSHHADFCSANGADCIERKTGPSRQQTGGRILAHILGRRLHVLDDHLRPSADDPANRDDLLDAAFSGLRAAVGRNVGYHGSLRDPKSCGNVLRGALALYNQDNRDDAREQTSLIEAEQYFTEALAEAVRVHFNAPNWKPTCWMDGRRCRSQ